jgi:surface polysaccharide O-acyltransferase-like enzyme
VWAGVSDFTLLPSKCIATSMTLFSFSLLRPMTSDATANAKLPMAAHCVPVNSIPQMAICQLGISLMLSSFLQQADKNKRYRCQALPSRI